MRCIINHSSMLRTLKEKKMLRYLLMERGEIIALMTIGFWAVLNCAGF